MKDSGPPDRQAPPGTRDDEERIARIWRMILGRIGLRAGNRTVRAGAPGWHNLRSGVLCKVLHEQGGMFSCLLQLAPGAVVPAGRSAAEQEWLVLQGSLRIGNVLVAAGDYHVDFSGTLHDALRTDSGALVFRRGPPLPMLSCPA
ncbi:MAG: cupin domain-containing protein [Burkholderiales bacterium]